MELKDQTFILATLNQLQEETGIPWSKLCDQMGELYDQGLIEVLQREHKGFRYPVFTRLNKPIS